MEFLLDYSWDENDTEIGNTSEHDRISWDWDSNGVYTEYLFFFFGHLFEESPLINGGLSLDGEKNSSKTLRTGTSHIFSRKTTILMGHFDGRYEKEIPSGKLRLCKLEPLAIYGWFNS